MDVRSFSGAVFDCDGVLVDSEQPWIELMERYLSAMGLGAADGITADALRGMSSQETVDALAAAHERRRPGVASASTSEWAGPPPVARVDEDYSRALEGLASPMPGAVAFVRALSGTVPIAVASNGRRRDVHGLLERVGLLALFDEIVTIDDVPRGKPAPDPYLLAASRLGLEAGDLVVFEDSAPGAAAGRSAGCTVIGVNADRATDLPAHARLRTFDDLDYTVDAPASADGHARLRVRAPWSERPAESIL
jgi:HAD superfamily hydrolase (TIGR01509 family)